MKATIFAFEKFSLGIFENGNLNFFFFSPENCRTSFTRQKLSALSTNAVNHISIACVFVTCAPRECSSGSLWYKRARSRSRGHLHRGEFTGSRFSLVFLRPSSCTSRAHFYRRTSQTPQVDNPPRVAPFLINDAHAFSSSSSFLLGASRFFPPPLLFPPFLPPSDKYARDVW